MKQGESNMKGAKALPSSVGLFNHKEERIRAAIAGDKKSPSSLLSTSARSQPEEAEPHKPANSCWPVKAP